VIDDLVQGAVARPEDDGDFSRGRFEKVDEDLAGMASMLCPGELIHGVPVLG